MLLSSVYIHTKVIQFICCEIDDKFESLSESVKKTEDETSTIFWQKFPSNQFELKESLPVENEDSYKEMVFQSSSVHWIEHALILRKRTVSWVQISWKNFEQTLLTSKKTSFVPVKNIIFFLKTLMISNNFQIFGSITFK